MTDGKKTEDLGTPVSGCEGVTDAEVRTLLTKLPAGTFLPRYLNAAALVTDAPLAYHVAVGLGMLANTLPPFENADGTTDFSARLSGISRKSTAVSMGERLLIDARVFETTIEVMALGEDGRPDPDAATSLIIHAEHKETREQAFPNLKAAAPELAEVLWGRSTFVFQGRHLNVAVGPIVERALMWTLPAREMFKTIAMLLAHDRLDYVHGSLNISVGDAEVADLIMEMNEKSVRHPDVVDYFS